MAGAWLKLEAFPWKNPVYSGSTVDYEKVLKSGPNKGKENPKFGSRKVGHGVGIVVLGSEPIAIGPEGVRVQTGVNEQGDPVTYRVPGKAFGRCNIMVREADCGADFLEAVKLNTRTKIKAIRDGKSAKATDTGEGVGEQV